MNSKKRKVLLIGWDAADWNVIHPLMEQGGMPHLEGLINGGTMGNLATINPVLSPMLWTSIATGKRPYKHGIHGFTEPNPNGQGVRLITNLSRSTKAVWNIFGQNGMKSNVIGWWPSHPVEPINGVMVSNHYHKSNGATPDSWPMPDKVVHPPELADALAQFRVHPEELDANQVLPFVPRGAEVDTGEDARIEMVAKTLAECASVHASSTAVMQNEPWDFMAIYHDAIDHFCHGFMRYHPPRQDHIDEKSFELYKGVVEGAYRFHDMMLGATLKLAGEDTTVILISDHGFHSDHLRPKEIPKEANGPAVEHSQYGIFVVKGPGIKKDEKVFGASLLDITPTLLSLYGLPVGEDMDGRVLSEIYESPEPVQTIPSWDDVAGNDGQHPEHHKFFPEDERDMIAQLEQLGYIDALDDDKTTSARKGLSELRFNLARSYVDADRHAESIPILEELYEDWPDEYRFINQLAYSYLSIGRIKDARAAVEKIVDLQKRLGAEARLKLRELSEQSASFADGKPPRNFSLKVQIEKYKLTRSQQPQNLLWGCILAAENDLEKALEVLSCIPEESWSTTIVPLRMAEISMGLKKFDQAGILLNKARAVDPQNARVYQLLMKLRIKQKLYPEAVQLGLTAVSRRYFFPKAHYQLATALVNMRFYPRAEDAYKVAISQAPRMIAAHLGLAKLYEQFLQKPELAKEHYAKVEELRDGADKKAETSDAELSGIRSQAITENLIIPDTWQEGEILTVVCGLPRSGTSLLMQMLDAGGIECFTDGVRQADDSNPKGFYELEKVKSLSAHLEILKEAEGKAIKIVAPLLNQTHGSNDVKIRVVFIERDLNEVCASQTTMLQRLGKDIPEESPEKLRKSYTRLLGRINEYIQKRGWPTLCLNYKDVINEPHEAARKLNEFCNNQLNEGNMVNVVDPSLYREKLSD